MKNKIKKIADSLETVLGILMLGVMVSIFGPLFFPGNKEAIMIVSGTAFMWSIIRIHMLEYRLKAYKPSSVELLKQAQMMRAYERRLAEESKIEWKTKIITFKEWSLPQKLVLLFFTGLPTLILILSAWAIWREEWIMDTNKIIIAAPVGLSYLAAYFWYFSNSKISVRADYEDDDEWASIIEDMSEKDK